VLDPSASCKQVLQFHWAHKPLLHSGQNQRAGSTRVY
jgi:hypothetical protein